MLSFVASLLICAMPAAQPGDSFEIQVKDFNGNGVPSATVKAADHVFGVTGPNGQITIPREPLTIDILPPPGSELQATRTAVTKDTKEVRLNRAVAQAAAPCCPCCCCSNRVLPWRRYCIPQPCCIPSVPAEEVQIVVSVPESASVTVNGKPTTSVGKTRIYRARNLQPGREYNIDLGTTMAGVEIHKTVALRAGETRQVVLDDFRPGPRPTPAVRPQDSGQVSVATE